MLEVIKVILDIVSKSFSIESIRKIQKEKKLKEIGTEIFLLYSSLNSIIILAHQIVNELEGSLERMLRKVNDNELDYVHCTALPFLLNQQEINILNFVKSIKRLRFEFELIDPESYKKLYPLIHGKRNAISEISEALSTNSPQLTSISEEKLLDFLKKSSKNTVEFEDGRCIQVSRHEEEIFEKLQISTLRCIPIKEYKIIQKYLEVRKPNNIIKELEKVAKTLRKAIKTNFSIEDILLEVGDKRNLLSSRWTGL